MRYRLSGQAEADLAAIFWYGLDAFGTARTEQYLQELEQTFSFLAEYPEAARLRSEIDPPIRAYPLKAHMILYDIEGENIVIVRIRSARENWMGHISGDTP